MDKVVETVLGYPKLARHLEKNFEDRAQIIRNIKEIRGGFNSSVVSGAIKLIDNTFGRLYDGVNFEIPKDFDLQEQMKSHHIVLVPNHQSHADYIALTYTIFGVYQIPVYVAGGINLNIFPIGKLFRNSGAFFIRRRFGDDITYKLAFEAYIYYLLKENLLVEFFFEGGRSRTGKLMSPRYGLFSMLLEAHKELNDGKPLMFVPVTLAHEHVPEVGAHAKELGGAKKEKESARQLLKMAKLFNRKLGTIHVRLNPPVVAEPIGDKDFKTVTQEIAFDCFLAVGRGMPITPTSLLALVLLDEASGAATKELILEKASEVAEYCRRFGIPLTSSLVPEKFEESLTKALTILVGNKKIELIEKEKLNKTFYAIRPECRVEILYFKNMILHHFLVPGFINSAWYNIFSGALTDATELTKFLLNKRREFKYEFYLPSFKEMLSQAQEVISYALGSEINDLKEVFNLNSKEMFAVASKVKMFSNAFSYLYEAYYISAMGIKYLGREPFSEEKFLNVTRELFDMEKEHGRVVQYPESFTVPIIKGTLKYSVNQKILSMDNDLYQVTDLGKVDTLIEKFVNIINDEVALNFKIK